MAPDPLAAAVDEIAALKAERANDRELIGQLYGRIEELKGHLYRAVIELEEQNNCGVAQSGRSPGS